MVGNIQSGGGGEVRNSHIKSRGIIVRNFKETLTRYQKVDVGVAQIYVYPFKGSNSLNYAE